MPCAASDDDRSGAHQAACRSRRRVDYDRLSGDPLSAACQAKDTKGHFPWNPRSLGNSSGRPLITPSRSEEHTSELQSLMRISYAVFCLKNKTTNKTKS